MVIPNPGKSYFCALGSHCQVAFTEISSLISALWPFTDISIASTSPNVILKARNTSSCCTVTAVLYAVPTAILPHLFVVEFLVWYFFVWLLNLFHLSCTVFPQHLLCDIYLSAISLLFFLAKQWKDSDLLSGRLHYLLVPLRLQPAASFNTLHLILQPKSFLRCEQKGKFPCGTKEEDELCMCYFFFFFFYIPKECYIHALALFKITISE